MTKTKRIILVLSLIALIGIGVVTFYVYNLNKIISVITLDINPSIEISLNYKYEVVKIAGLNDDGKELIKDNQLKSKTLEKTIEKITEKVIEKGYVTEEDNYILINVDGKDIKDKVVTLINDEFKEKDTECNVITQEINEDAKKSAEKYGISENKASYIESIIKNNDELTFEELKDKSINEINKMVKSEEVDKKDEVEENQKKEDNKQEESKPNNNTSNKPSTSTPNKKPVSTPPASDDRTGAWCEFYKTIPPEGGVEYETPGYINDASKYIEASKKHFPEDANWSEYFNSITSCRTASYCSCGLVELENYDKTKTYTVYLDSVTLELLELKVTELAKPNIDEAGAKVIVTKWLLDQYGIDINDCGWESYYYAIDGSTKIPEWQYICKIEETTTYYTVTVDALNGSLSGDRTWTN